MATDCYQLYKTTYNQAIADGLSTAAAIGAAQSAMTECLRSQNNRPTTTVQQISVDSVRRDPGPSVPIPGSK